MSQISGENGTQSETLRFHVFETPSAGVETGSGAGEVAAESLFQRDSNSDKTFPHISPIYRYEAD